MADNQTEALLALQDRGKGGQSFAIKGFQYLDFETMKLDRFQWNKTGEKVEDFDSAEAFTEFDEVYVGYDPMNRDQGEIRLYAAKLVPEKLGLAVDYGRLLARQWGPLNFGVKLRDPSFGEVMTGRDNVDGGQEFTRLSVFRRGAELLVIRADGPEESWQKFGPKVASFVGSLHFDQEMNKDPLLANFTTEEIAIDRSAGSKGQIEVRMPTAWRALPITNDSDPKAGIYRFYVNDADKGKSSGVMIFSIDARAATRQVEPPQLAQTMGEILLDNVLQGQPYQFQPMGENGVPDLDGKTDVNGYYLFKVAFPEIDMLGGVSVLLTMKDQHWVGYAMVSAYPTDLWHQAATLNPTLVEYQLRTAVADYWRNVGDAAR
ncbi:hypothetical protein [Fulvimarina sp. MAC8]|uniref:hypothetical protein n=1 Tax=Fulvimarina sp. MAC8 TaxID=3162874 RepID=UPI0032EB2CEE